MENKSAQELWPISCSCGVKYIEHPFNSNNPQDHQKYIEHLKKDHMI